MSALYKVVVVLDRAFGDRLTALKQDIPVWIVDTPVNRAVAERCWREHPVETHLTGVTIFKDRESSSPEELLMGELDSIDLHHGIDSADPPYSVLEVIGAGLTERVRALLGKFGFDEFQEGPHGFMAMRRV